MLDPCPNLAHSVFYLLPWKVTVCLLIWDAVCLGDATIEDLWVCASGVQEFVWQGMCCWAHRCFFQRRVERSREKERSQVHVLEAHWVWVAPRCPLNTITEFTRPLLFPWECNTVINDGGVFSVLLHLRFKSDSLPHLEFTWTTALDERENISIAVLWLIYLVYEDESLFSAW